MIQPGCAFVADRFLHHILTDPSRCDALLELVVVSNEALYKS